MTTTSSQLEPTSKENSLTTPIEAGRMPKASLAGFESKSAHYPEGARTSAGYLFQFMHERANGSPAMVADILKKISSHDYPDKEQYVYQVTTGRYFRTATGKMAVENLNEMAERLRQWDIMEQQRGRVPFNENLRTWIAVKNYIDMKRARGAVFKFGAIQGDTGSGKTACTKHYKMLNNHYSTVRLESPGNSTLSRFVMKLGDCYNIPRSYRTNDRLVELDGNVNDTRTIIIENIQKLYNPKSGPRQPIFSFLQELQDDTDCTIIGTWTPTFANEIVNGRDSLYFAQFVSRIGGIDDVCVLPPPNKKDILSIIDQWQIADAQNAYPILAKWARQPGSYRLIYGRIQKATLLAGTRGLSAQHLELVTTTPVQTQEDGL